MISWFCLYRFPSFGPASLRQEPHPKATRRLRQSLVHNPPQRVRANPHMRTKPYAKGPCIGVRIYAAALETANRVQARRHYQRQGVSKDAIDQSDAQGREESPARPAATASIGRSVLHTRNADAGQPLQRLSPSTSRKNIADSISWCWLQAQSACRRQHMCQA